MSGTAKRAFGFGRIGALLALVAGIGLVGGSARLTHLKALKNAETRVGLGEENELENDGAAEYAEWRAIGQRDESGRIDPDGLKKGLLQREKMMEFNQRYKVAKWSGGWSLIGSTTQAGRTTGMAIDPTNSAIMYAATAGGGLWKSTDSGVHWSLANDRWGSIACGSVTIDPADHNTIYVGTGEWTINSDAINGDGIYVSTDSGSTFNKLASTAPFDRISSISIDPTNSNNILTGVVSRRAGFARGIYLSTDKGGTWTQVLAGVTDIGASDVQFDSTGTRAIATCYDGSVYRLYYSSDGGATWTEATGFTTVDRLNRPTMQYAPS
ncbi:MAG: hypothetical protein ABUL49_01820, partial [bacterium]